MTMITASKIQISFRSGFSSAGAGSSVPVTIGVSAPLQAPPRPELPRPGLALSGRRRYGRSSSFFGDDFSGGRFRKVEYGLHFLCREDLRGAGRDDRGRQHVASLEVSQAHGLAIHDDLDAALLELALGELAGSAVLELHVDGVTDPLHDRTFLDRGYDYRANPVVVVIWAVPFIPGVSSCTDIDLPSTVNLKPSGTVTSRVPV